MQSETVCVADRLPKHLAIQDQIDHIRNISRQMENLIMKVRGEEPDAPKLVNQEDQAKISKMRPPSLAETLVNAPEELSELGNMMNDQIRILEDLIL